MVAIAADRACVMRGRRQPFCRTGLICLGVPLSPALTSGQVVRQADLLASSINSWKRNEGDERWGEDLAGRNQVSVRSRRSR